MTDPAKVAEVIPQSIRTPMERCPGYPDFPTAMAIQRDRGSTLAHHERCSSASSFLCDCGAVVDEWNRLRAHLQENNDGC